MPREAHANRMRDEADRLYRTATRLLDMGLATPLEYAKMSARADELIAKAAKLRTPQRLRLV